MNTRKKNSSPAIARLRDYYENIIAHMPGHVYWKNVDGVYLGCNSQQAHDAGFASPKAFSGKTDFEMPWANQAQYLRDIDQKVMQSAQPHTIEENFELPDGTTKLYLSKKVPLFDEQGKVEGILGISFDISEKREAAEKLKQAKRQAEMANKAKTEFIKNMSHDIRTPLAGMIALSESLYQRAVDPQDREDAHDLYKATKQLLKLLNEVLEIASFDAENPEQEYKPFNINDMVLSLKELMQPLADKKAIALHAICDERLNIMLQSQPLLLHRVLLNIIGNAIKFTDSGHVKLLTEYVQTNHDRISLRIHIIDTGIGMQADLVDQMFQPFQKASPSYEGKYQGLGLGLYIAKQFMEQLGGTISVQSSPKKGSHFICELSLAITQGPTITETDYGPIDIAYHPEQHRHSKPISDNNDSHWRILLVEDTPIAQKAARLKLQSIGAAVDVAPSGRDALDMATKKSYDLIYMDIGLPDINGYIVTERIRQYEQQNNLAETPIIALTAHVDDKGEKKCYDAGMNFVIHKPLLSDYAERLIERFVKNKQTQTLSTECNSQPVIDWSVAVKTLGSLENAKEMFQLFLNELPQLKQSITQAYSQQDIASLIDSVHRLNGSASYAPTPRLKQAAMTLEKQLKKQQGDIAASYQQLIQEVDWVLERQ